MPAAYKSYKIFTESNGFKATLILDNIANDDLTQLANFIFQRAKASFSRDFVSALYSAYVFTNDEFADIKASIADTFNAAKNSSIIPNELVDDIPRQMKNLLLSDKDSELQYGKAETVAGVFYKDILDKIFAVCSSGDVNQLIDRCSERDWTKRLILDFAIEHLEKSATGYQSSDSLAKKIISAFVQFDSSVFTTVLAVLAKQNDPLLLAYFLIDTKGIAGMERKTFEDFTREYFRYFDSTALNELIGKQVISTLTDALPETCGHVFEIIRSNILRVDAEKRLIPTLKDIKRCGNSRAFSEHYNALIIDVAEFGAKASGLATKRTILEFLSGEPCVTEQQKCLITDAILAEIPEFELNREQSSAIELIASFYDQRHLPEKLTLIIAAESIDSLAEKRLFSKDKSAPVKMIEVMNTLRPVFSVNGGLSRYDEYLAYFCGRCVAIITNNGAFKVLSQLPFESMNYAFFMKMFDVIAKWYKQTRSHQDLLMFILFGLNNYIERFSKEGASVLGLNHIPAEKFEKFLNGNTKIAALVYDTFNDTIFDKNSEKLTAFIKLWNETEAANKQSFFGRLFGKK